MPQELHVIRCYSCEAFQVHIVKKSPRWECKICGEKQSLKKVYGVGSGKDCRLLVQELNYKRLDLDSRQNQCFSEETALLDCSNFQHITTNRCTSENESSKWNEFMPESSLSSETLKRSQDDPNYNLDEESCKCTFERPVKKRKCLQKNKNVPKSSNLMLSANTTSNRSSDNTGKILNENFNTTPEINICKTGYDSNNSFETMQFMRNAKFSKQIDSTQSGKDTKNSKWISFLQDNKDCNEDKESCEHLEHTNTVGSDNLKQKSTAATKPESKWNEFIFEDQIEGNKIELQNTDKFKSINSAAPLLDTEEKLFKGTDKSKVDQREVLQIKGVPFLESQENVKKGKFGSFNYNSQEVDLDEILRL